MLLGSISLSLRASNQWHLQQLVQALTYVPDVAFAMDLARILVDFRCNWFVQEAEAVSLVWQGTRVPWLRQGACISHGWAVRCLP